MKIVQSGETDSTGQIVIDGKVLIGKLKIDEMTVWSDEKSINIDLDINDNQLKDTFFNVSMSKEQAELVVFLLDQAIKKYIEWSK